MVSAPEKGRWVKGLKPYFLIPGNIFPFSCQPASFNGISTLIEINGRAYVDRQPVDDISRMLPMSLSGLHYQMLFTLSNRLPVRSIEKIYPAGQLIYGGDGFMSQVQA